ncbi:MFS general substrate transporter [Annulohypoxylon truncatum]|uniref:MFS general substrate transporter n=1 Tax=Annulohypoxylon truncatum TaxID=327061 RepID=UPI00200724A7|nr:MFS general substrate transporter [Annulohypoxylon truncatum]KAI1205823.1 MFS general substrate transporter [Annulohypoxylon truncatum]
MDDIEKPPAAPRSHDNDEQQDHSTQEEELTSSALVQGRRRSQPEDSDSESNPDSQGDEERGGEAQDLETLSRVSSGPPYTAFSNSMRWWIVFMNCISAFLSPITANIYFPAIPALSQDLGVSVAKINLTLTTYMILQGLAPTIFGDFADIAGRRPAFIIACTIYLAANIGLALQRNYAALLVLRMVQSGGSSGTIALVYGVVADIAPSSERGKFMGIVGAGLTIGPALGPVIGGLLSQYLGWPAIFWFLCILAVCWLIPYILAVPETGRKVVGNGSIPPQGWNMTLLDYIRFRRQAINRPSSHVRQKLRLPNPLNTLSVIGNKDMALVLGYNALLYVGFQIVTATLASQFADIYHYNEIQLGLCYLPIGGATMLSSISTGYILDWNFRRIAKKLGVRVTGKRGNDLKGFPIEKARLQVAYPLVVIGLLVSIGYGWALQYETHVVVPLVLSFFIGIGVTGPFQIINVLIVDLYPQAPATATAANNLTRCLSGAVATAIIQYIIDAWGRGWTYTFIALIYGTFSPALWIIQKYGPKWREERMEKMKQAIEKKEAEAREKNMTTNEQVLAENQPTCR